MNAAAAVARILKAEGVTFISCFPEAALIDACASEGIRPVIARSERVVVNIADGYSRLAARGQVGVAVMQYGPGIENAFSGVAQAYADSVPILVLPARSPRRQNSVNPDFDAVLNLRGITKWAAQINMADRVPSVLRRAFTALRNGRPGPVLIELPQDVAQEEIDENRFSYEPVRRSSPGPDPADVREAISMLLKAERPLILAGQGIHYAEAYDALRRFAEVMHIPVMTTVGGKSAFPENHPLALGVGGLSTTGMVAHYLARADLVFAIGSSLTKWWMMPTLSEKMPIIQSSIDERDLNKSYAIKHAVMGDANLVLRALVAEAEDRQRSTEAVARSPVDEIRSVKHMWLQKWLPKLTSPQVPLNPYRVIWDLSQTVNRANTIVTHDSGNPREQLAPFWESVEPRGYVGWGHSTQLGYSLGLMMGAKLARPDKVVINVLGDAALGMVGMDLETASRAGIGLLTILLNNSAMGNYEQHMPIATKRFAAKKLTGDYSQLAGALGVYAERVTKPDDVIPAIQRGLEIVASGRPALLEFITCEEPAQSGYGD